MQLRMWTYDVAREQTPSLEHFRMLCDATLRGGYNALGLYLEHRFAYPSTPWSHGRGCVTPELVRQIIREYPQIQIIPFVNLLGHFEGMLYTEEGKRYREERFKGMQACPSNPGFVDLCRRLIDDTVEVFDSKVIHIGGDETAQLGNCPACAARVEAGNLEGRDGKAILYGEHFGPLAQYVLAKGRRPAVWGDMYLEHPTALDAMPKETLIFDWQYFTSPFETSRNFIQRGFDVVCCPTLHTYNAAWLHLPQSEANVRQAADAARRLDAFGVCLTTWECALFGNYESLIPAIEASGELMGSNDRDEDTARSFSWDSNDQISSDEYDDAGSIAVGVSDSILMNALDGSYSVMLEHEPDEVRITVVETGEPQGSLPLEMAQNTIRHLLFRSNIDPFRTNREPVGQITGSYRGRPYRFDVTAIGDLRQQPTLRLINADAMKSPTADLREAAEIPQPRAFLSAYGAVSEEHREWAEIMGVKLQELGRSFAFSGTRSSLKVRLLLQSNPFLAWLHHREEFIGETGDRALQLLERAIQIAPNPSYRSVSEFVRLAIEFVRYAEQSRQAYANELPGVATSALAPARQVFENLEKIARANHLNIGGSLADIERCRVAREHVERVMKRIKDFGDGSLGYLPAYEHITHPSFVPHDQGAWWLINSWARE